MVQLDHWSHRTAVARVWGTVPDVGQHHAVLLVPARVRHRVVVHSRVSLTDASVA